MNLLGQVIRALIYLCFIALAFYLIIWVFGAIGLHLPAIVVNILLVILVLVAILVLLQLFGPYVSGIDWWGNKQPPKQ